MSKNLMLVCSVTNTEMFRMCYINEHRQFIVQVEVGAGKLAKAVCVLLY